jgi:hypothetical protein
MGRRAGDAAPVTHRATWTDAVRWVGAAVSSIKDIHLCPSL